MGGLKHEKFFVFYFTWFASLVENLLHADLVLNINLLSSNPAYRNKINHKIKRFTAGYIDFRDSKIKEWADSGILPANSINQIKETVQSLILKQYSDEDIHHVFHNLDDKNRKFFKLDESEWKLLKEKPLPAVDLFKEKAQKVELIFKFLPNEIANLLHLTHDSLQDRIKTNHE